MTALVTLAIVVGYVLVAVLIVRSVGRRLHTRDGFPAEHRADRWDR